VLLKEHIITIENLQREAQQTHPELK